MHYGTPVNPQESSRIPGGSSSGSAVAVAAGIVDFALGMLRVIYVKIHFFVLLYRSFCCFPFLSLFTLP